MGLFEEQLARKPNKYPWTEKFIEVTQAGFWTHREFSFQSDIQDFKVNLTDQEKLIIIKSLSSIGQIEIAVKLFWGNIGKNLPHPSLIDLGFVLANTECYSEDTEVLTPIGWKYLKNMKIGDSVFQVTNFGCIEPTIVLDTISKYYDGEMYEFHQKNSNCLVTPNHEMLVQREKTTGWSIEKIQAKDLKFHSSLKILKTVIYSEGKIDTLTSLERIYIAVQADGTLRYNYDVNGNIYYRGKKGGFTHDVRFKKERKINRFRQLLLDAKIRFTESPVRSDGCTNFSIQLQVGESYKDFSWVDLSNKTSNWCKEFVEELILWDGSTTQQTYFSKFKANVDFCQKIGILAGYTTTTGYTEDNRGKGYSTKYRVCFSQQKKNRWRHTTDLKKNIINYKGHVYCITVSSGNILTRRNGKTFIAGNCIHGNAYERLLEVLGIEDSFEEILNLKIIKNRVTYLKKHLEHFSFNDKQQFIYSLILFTLFIENISLFSQFYIISWFNKNKNLLKDTNKQIEYTAREEFIHTLVGIKIVNTLREEYPNLFDEELKEKIIKESKNAVEYECEIVNWILEDVNYPDLNPTVVREFLTNRLNWALNQIGYGTPFVTKEEEIKKTTWFDELLLSNSMTDFFHGKPTEYVQKSQSFDELF